MEQLKFGGPDDGSCEVVSQKGHGPRYGLLAAAMVSVVLAAAAGGFFLLLQNDTPLEQFIGGEPAATAASEAEARLRIEDAQIEGLGSEIYTGSEVIPSLQVRLNGDLLSEGTDYRLAGSDNILPGQAHLMVFGMGEYEGELYPDFTIVMDDPVCDDPDNAALLKFVNRFYNIVYSRNASRDEMIDIVGRLYDGSLDGCTLAEEFFTSEQIAGRGLSDDEFVCLLYRTLLGRRAESEGRQSWCSVLSEGTTRAEVVTMFASSDEFRDLCRGYGITARFG